MYLLFLSIPNKFYFLNNLISSLSDVYILFSTLVYLFAKVNLLEPIPLKPTISQNLLLCGSDALRCSYLSFLVSKIQLCTKPIFVYLHSPNRLAPYKRGTFSYQIKESLQNNKFYTSISLFISFCIVWCNGFYGATTHGN